MKTRERQLKKFRANGILLWSNGYNPGWGAVTTQIINGAGDYMEFLSDGVFRIKQRLRVMYYFLVNTQ